MNLHLITILAGTALMLAVCGADASQVAQSNSRISSSIPYTMRLGEMISQIPTKPLSFEAEEAIRDESRNLNSMVLYTNLAGIGFVTAWGVWRWDYFSRSPHNQSEGWFGYNTSSGGADKLGHLYSSYAASHAFSWFYEHNGMKRDDAAFHGSLSSFIIMGYMEFGDSFSPYGFSYEDMIANTLGCLSGYVLYRYPELARRVDIRVEIGLQPESSDVITDYDNTKYLLAFKLNGFEATEKSFLKYIELHVGYYTRGYENEEPDRDRNLYVGIGLNLTDMFRRKGYKRTATVLNYVQPPYTSLNYRHEIN